MLGEKQIKQLRSEASFKVKQMNKTGIENCPYPSFLPSEIYSSLVYNSFTTMMNSSLHLVVTGGLLFFFFSLYSFIRLLFWVPSIYLSPLCLRQRRYSKSELDSSSPCHLLMHCVSAHFLGLVVYKRNRQKILDFHYNHMGVGHLISHWCCWSSVFC